VKASILSTGEELVRGRTQDTNAGFLASRIGAVGFHVVRIVVLGDDGDLVREEVLRCARDSDLILLSGGLGPTADDRTRWAIAEAAGVELEEDAESRRFLEARLRGFGRALNEAQLSQARFPAGSVVFPNPRGTARGFACRVGRAWLVAMPGVPGELRGMFQESVLPFVLDRLGPGGCVLTRTVHLFPIPEPDVDERLGDMMDADRNPLLGITARDGVITVSITARADDEEAARRLLERDVETVRERFGEAVFGYDEDTLASVLGDLLIASGRTLGVAESVTGGLIGHMLVEVPGISRCFLGDVVAYSNELKTALLGVPAELIRQHGAVSAQVAESMASGVCNVTGAGIGLSTTGIAGPTGGSKEKPVGLVYVGLAMEGTVSSTRLELRGDRARIRDRAAKHALNLARLALVRGRLFSATAAGP